MYAGVPTRLAESCDSDCVTSCPSCDSDRVANPKSSTLTSPSAPSAQFAVLRSRWMMPRACAWARRGGDLIGKADHGFRRQPSGRDAPVESLPGNELHRDPFAVFGFTDVVDVADVGMIERGCGLRFAKEPSALRPVKKLQGDVTAKARVASPVHFAHSTGADDGGDFVRPDAGSGGQCHRPLCRMDSIRRTAISEKRLANGVTVAVLAQSRRRADRSARRRRGADTNPPAAWRRRCSPPARRR